MENVAPLNRTAQVESAITRIMTLYEHTQDSGHELPTEDEENRYIYVPTDDEERVIKFFRRGWKPAKGHVGNGPNQVALFKSKGVANEIYEKEVMRRKTLHGDEDARRNLEDDSRTVDTKAGQTLTERALKDRLPDVDPDEADASADNG